MKEARMDQTIKFGPLQIDEATLAKLCRRYHVRELPSGQHARAQASAEHSVIKIIADSPLLAGRPNPGGCGAILDNGEIAGDPIRTYIEWICFARFAVCGAVGFEECIVEL